MTGYGSEQVAYDMDTPYEETEEHYNWRKKLSESMKKKWIERKKEVKK